MDGIDGMNGAIVARWSGAFGVVVAPPRGPIQELELEGGRAYVLGRAPGDRVGAPPIGRVDVDDATVSPAHARLEACVDGVQLTDLGSAAGCWIGGARVASARLGVGASVLVGATTLTIVGAAELEPDSSAPAEEDAVPGAIGRSLPMRSLGKAVARYAALSVPVMIRGESGAGKELVARALHLRSPRARGPFEAINVSTLTRELAESELFGHERGAFTGAATAREGLFERADGGTLFLDEIADLSLDLQAKLLRVLETGETRRLGARASKRVDVRIVAATWAPLEQRIDEGAFREDLFHRIAVLMIDVPPLRERVADIPEIAAHFLDRQRAELGRKRLTLAAMSRLMSERWPGNVRQLRNVVVRAAAQGSDVEVGLAEIVHALRTPTSTPPPAPSKPRIVASVRDRSEATALVEAHGGSIAAAARTCGVPRETMRDWVNGATRRPRGLAAVAT